MYRRLKQPKECPGCHDMVLKLAGERLCQECSRLIAVGKQFEAAAKTDDMVNIKIGCGFEYKHQVLSHKSWDTDFKVGQWKSAEREFVRVLAELVSRADPRLLDLHDEPFKRKLPHLETESIACPPGDYFVRAVVTTDDVSRLCELLALTYVMIQEAEARGYCDGRNLIAGLQNGTVSISRYDNEEKENLKQ